MFRFIARLLIALLPLASIAQAAVLPCLPDTTAEAQRAVDAAWNEAIAAAGPASQAAADTSAAQPHDDAHCDDCGGNATDSCCHSPPAVALTSSAVHLPPAQAARSLHAPGELVLGGVRDGPFRPPSA